MTPALPGPDPVRWSEDVTRIVGRFLVPQEIRSILIIQPAASGDIALTTTLIAQIKRLNPRCHVTLAMRAATVPVAAMCPEIDALEVISLELALRGRRETLQYFAGRADMVVHCWYFGEHPELGQHYNLRETIYLLAGWPTPPDRPASIRLQASRSDRSGGEILRAVLSRSGRWPTCRRWIGNAWREILFCLGEVLKGKKPLGKSGLRSSLYLFLRVIKGTRQLLGMRPPPGLSRCVMLSFGAFSLGPPPAGMAALLVQKLSDAGWTVLQNLGGPSEPLVPGAVPLCCSYDDFLQLRHGGIPLVSWRSGICDVAAAVESVPMVALYPPLIPPHPRPCLELFGFESMGIRGDILDLACPSTESMDWPRLIGHLDGRAG